MIGSLIIIPTVRGIIVIMNVFKCFNNSDVNAKMAIIMYTLGSCLSMGVIWYEKMYPVQANAIVYTFFPFEMYVCNKALVNANGGLNTEIIG